MDQTDEMTEQKHIARAQMSDAEMDAYVEAWLPDDFDYRVATKRENDEWFALAVDFDVTGKGATRAAALRQMAELVAIYLAAYVVDGASFQVAVCQCAARMRLRLQLESALGRVLGHLYGRLPLSREDNYILPASEVAVHARC